MPKKVLDLYEPMIVSLASDKIKVVIITDCAADIEKASVYISAEPLYQVRIIADSSKVLTGDFEGRDMPVLRKEKSCRAYKRLYKK